MHTRRLGRCAECLPGSPSRWGADRLHRRSTPCDCQKSIGGAVVSRRLVEECACFSLAMARRQLGHPALLEAYRRGHAIIWPGVPAPIDLAADVVHLPWKGDLYNPRAYSERLRLQCPRSWRGVLVLYGVPTALGRDTLGCRRCLGLVYYSQHCSGNRWYEFVVKPLRRLRRLKATLAGPLRRAIRQRLEHEQAHLRETIAYWQSRLQPRAHDRPPRRRRRASWSAGAPTPAKRPYRSLRYV
jgi:hypothetical protein